MLTFGTGYYEPNSIQFGFLTFLNGVGAVSPSASRLLFLKLVMSLLFPLTVAVAYFQQVKSSRLMQLSWINLAVGAAYMYLFYEDGNRFLHANFTWNGEIALFVLYAVSGIIFLKQWFINAESRAPGSREWLVLAIFCLHLICGVFWYYLHVGGGAAAWFEMWQ
jgi:hypothetical protein